MRLALLVALAGCGDNVQPRVLFIHGGSGTGGFVDGINDVELSSIDDADSGFGFGDLAGMLRDDGYALDQLEEGPVTAKAPVDLVAADLSRYAIVFFASNNATYTADDAALVTQYIHDGGAALFVSDANWGLNWDQAPSSDQTFLTPFGLVMNQDNGGGIVTIGPADYVEPSHPILRGVDLGFQGEGVSACTLSHDPAALGTVTRLTAMTAMVRRNTAPEGPVEAPTADDTALAVVQYGNGRVACSFDRNTFFNANGAGSSLSQVDNTTYARNLFRWLGGRI